MTGRRCGLTRVVAETLVLVIAVMIILLIIGPLNSYVSSAISGSVITASPSDIEILSLYLADSPCTSGVCIELAVKNNGPLSLRNADRWGSWVLIIDDYYCGEPDYVDVGGDDTLDVGEVAKLRWSDNQCTRYAGSYTSSIYAIRDRSYVVKVFGPEGTFTAYTYFPG
ncbi:MAG TPA: hypothetical protein ENG69_05275 [Candidatus Korarchaeota archaeon]|nr:hypothetical protein [Candidatus Korarchaeota archaeon]